MDKKSSPPAVPLAVFLEVMDDAVKMYNARHPRKSGVVNNAYSVIMARLEARFKDVRIELKHQRLLRMAPTTWILLGVQMITIVLLLG